jgi:hypothetical protein
MFSKTMYSDWINENFVSACIFLCGYVWIIHEWTIEVMCIIVIGSLWEGRVRKEQSSYELRGRVRNRGNWRA